MVQRRTNETLQPDKVKGVKIVNLNALTRRVGPGEPLTLGALRLRKLSLISPSTGAGYTVHDTRHKQSAKRCPYGLFISGAGLDSYH
jgi:hypothetical protein